MNRVRASGRNARRVARVEDRLRRGEPARRRAHAPFPSGRLRDGWPSARLHRTVGPASSRLLGARGPTAASAPRAQVPVRARGLHPSPFQAPVGLGRTLPADLAPADLAPADLAPADLAPADLAPETASLPVVGDAPIVLEPPALLLVPPVATPDTTEVSQAEPEPEAITVEPAVDPVAVASEPEVAEAVDLVAAEPGPEPVVAESVIVEPVVAEPEPEPEPVIVEPVVAEPEPVVEPVVAEPEPVVEPVVAEPVAVAPVTEPVTEPVAVTPAVEPVDTPWAALTPTDDTFTGPLPAPSRPARRTLLLVGAAVVVLAVGGTVAGVAASRSGSSGDTGTTSTVAAASADDLAGWLRANVASGTPVVTTDAVLATALDRRGLAVTTVPDLTGAPADSVVVATGGAAGPTPGVVTPDRSLVPLAQFATGAGSYGIGQLVDRAAADVTADRESAVSTARAATVGLLDNAAVDIRAGARPAFAAGTLDLRTAAFLALLAQAQQVRVVSAPQAASEAAVGLPVRSLVVTVADRDALRAVVDSARYPYAPTVAATPSDPTVPADAVLLVWPVIADPALTVN